VKAPKAKTGKSKTTKPKASLCGVFCTPSVSVRPGITVLQVIL